MPNQKLATLPGSSRTVGAASPLDVTILDGSGNPITSFGGSGGTSEQDDADFTDGTTSGTPAMGVYESTPSTVTDGDLGVVGITNDRALRVNVDNSGDIGGGIQYTQGDTDASITGTAILMEGGADTLLPVQGTVADGLLVNLGANNDVTVAGVATSAKQDTIIGHLDGVEGVLGTIDADTGNISTKIDTLAGAVAGSEMQVDVLTLPAIPAGNNNIGDVDIASIAAGNNNIGDVDVASIAAGDNNIGNVDIVSGVITTVTTVSTVTAITGGGIAHDAADSGNPLKIGVVAYSPDGTTPGTAVTEGDRSNAKGDLDGRLLVSADHPRSLHKHLDGTAAYTDEALVADPGDGFQVVITNIIASNGEAIAINFFLEEGSTKIFGPVYLPAVAGSGFCSGPIRLPVTASTAVTLTSSAANDQSFDVDYYIQAV